MSLSWSITRFALAVCAAACAAQTSTAEPSFDDLAREYAESTQPLVKRLCLDCHATDVKEGELDLEQFATLPDARRGASTWVKVAEMLVDQMPPKDAPQPTADERRQLQDWVRRFLDAEALAQAGDPGPVVLRRLSNAEYTYTIQDLTGVPLDVAREFPVDGAAGEGFTNTGQALVMSPALLTKYFDAAKDVAAHAVLSPEGLRFSPYATRRDWTDELVGQIKALYALSADAEGKLPLAGYLAATLEERQALAGGGKSLDQVAAARGLNARYLAALWQFLNGPPASPVLAAVQAHWQSAGPADVGALAGEIQTWQQALARFQNVGHMKPWVVEVEPLVTEQELRLKIDEPSADRALTVYLTSSQAGDGPDGDVVEFRNPRLVTPGRPDVALRDLRAFLARFEARRQRFVDATRASLEVAAGLDPAAGPPDVARLAADANVDPEALAAWLDYLGLGNAVETHLDYFTQTLTNISGYEFVRGWGSPETPSISANSSTQHVRIPGNLKGRGVVVHPAPTLNVAVGWRSPVAGPITISAAVTHAHPECGNGVTWSLQLRRGPWRQVLAEGIAHGGQPVAIGPHAGVVVRAGDLVSMLIGPRDGNHACDLTDVEFSITSGEATPRTWSLSADVTPDILAGNPHADGQGNAAVWHFYTEPVAGAASPAIAAGSLLARWQTSDKPDERRALAGELQALLRAGPPADREHPDAVLYRRLMSSSGPLFARAATGDSGGGAPDASEWALDPALFGHLPDGSAIDPQNLCLATPAALAIRLPADLLAGSELVATAALHPGSAASGSAQVRLTAAPPADLAALAADVPVLIGPDSPRRAHFAQAFADFRRLFPVALCYSRIVPVDEVITLTLFHREDEALARLMLDDNQRATLERLWRELRFVSQDALTTVDALAQLLEYASQDSDPGLFTPLRPQIEANAAALRERMLAAEPSQLDAVLDLAARAYRQPLVESETAELRALYQKLRSEELPHDEALRLTLARVLVSPAFLYKLEEAPAGREPAEVNDWQLATRLSYFLWSSLPDAELARAAAAGELRDPDHLAAQARRMLADDKVRRLAAEFACQWLHIYDFDQLDEKSERHFPTFTAVRGDMHEEAIRFFTDLFQRDGSWEDVFSADYVFVNESLAGHYNIPGVTGPEWRRVDAAGQFDRGGILGLGAILATQSGASRTSPVLRGTWVSEALLGEKLPKPPKDVPPIPDDEAATEGLTVRQIVERHVSDARCSSCHERIDPLGFALESFDAIGRRRDRDLGDRPIDAAATLKDGTQFSGRAGLRDYLLGPRRDTVIEQFSKKLLGYALGRAVQLSDRPLLAEMRRNLETNDGRLSAAVETIVRSEQFRMIRGREAEIAGSP